jgi:hypothetical protein
MKKLIPLSTLKINSNKNNLFTWFLKRTTNAQESGGFFINSFQILPRHVSAYGCHSQVVVSAL